MSTPKLLVASASSRPAAILPFRIHKTRPLQDALRTSLCPDSLLDESCSALHEHESGSASFGMHGHHVVHFPTHFPRWIIFGLVNAVPFPSSSTRRTFADHRDILLANEQHKNNSRGQQTKTCRDDR